MSTNFVNVSQWALDNGMDSMTVIRIAKKYKVQRVKIGTGYFIENADLLEFAIKSHLEKTKESLEKRSVDARKRAELSKEVMNRIKRMLIDKVETSQILEYINEVEEELKPKTKKGGQ